MTTTLTRTDFQKSIEFDRKYFSEFRKFYSSIYRIEYLDSFIKCAIQKTEEGVQIIYLDSEYKEEDHKNKLIGYATFIIAHRLNKKKPFEKIVFNKDGDIFEVN